MRYSGGNSVSGRCDDGDEESAHPRCGRNEFICDTGGDVPSGSITGRACRDDDFNNQTDGDSIFTEKEAIAASFLKGDAI